MTLLTDEDEIDRQLDIDLEILDMLETLAAHVNRKRAEVVPLP